MSFTNRETRVWLFVGVTACLFFVGCSSSSNGDSSLYKGVAKLEGAITSAEVTVCKLSTFIETGMCVPVYQTYTNNTEDNEQIGSFSIPGNVINSAESFYLIKIQGGTESAPEIHIPVTPLSADPIGQYHAILTPDQIRQGDFRVSILTEIIYQRIALLIKTGSSLLIDTIPSEVAKASYFALAEDVNGDGKRNAYDIAVWDPDNNRDVLPYAWLTYHILIERVRNYQELGELAISLSAQTGVAMYIDVTQDMAFVSVGEDGVYVYDITNTDIYDKHALIHTFLVNEVYDQNPIFSNYSRSEDLVVIDDLLYMSTFSVGSGIGIYISGTGLQVYDITQLPHPDPVSKANKFFESLNDPIPLQLLESHMALSEPSNFYSIDITNPIVPIGDTIHTYYSDIGGSVVEVRRLAGAAEILFALDNFNQRDIYVIDMQNPAQPSIIDQFEGGLGSVTAMEAQGSALYVLDVYDTLRIYNISDPANIQLIGSIDVSSILASSIAVSDNIVFVGGSNAILKVDVSNPTNPVVIGSLETNGWVKNIALARPIICVIETTSFGIYYEDDFIVP